MSAPELWAKKHLDYEFGDIELLNQAITHRSYSSLNNERLEFLGDSVLGLTIAEALYRQEADIDEGALTRLRALLVRGQTLAEIGRELQLGNIMQMGSGEARSGDHQRDSILADGMEALFGAVLLDGGIEAARKVILGIYQYRLANLPGIDTLKDPKSLLQEHVQAEGIELPVYTVFKEVGPPHARQFSVRCEIAAHEICTEGHGASRRAAEQEAAGAALLHLQDE